MHNVTQVGPTVTPQALKQNPLRARKKDPGVCVNTHKAPVMTG